MTVSTVLGIGYVVWLHSIFDPEDVFVPYSSRFKEVLAL